jgi:hypothetical protein
VQGGSYERADGLKTETATRQLCASDWDRCRPCSHTLLLTKLSNPV